MNHLRWLALASCLALSHAARAQSATAATTHAAVDVPLSAAAVILDRFGKLYYRPVNDGLLTFTCQVRFDFDTFPLLFRAPAEIGGKAKLSAVSLEMTAGFHQRPAIKRTYPADISAALKTIYDNFFDTVQGYPLGFIQTWAPKALSGPIPDARDVLSMHSNATGYRIHVPSPNTTVEIATDSQGVVTQILTQQTGQVIDEHPVFKPSPKGLLYAGTKVDITQSSATHVAYELDYQPVDIFLLPHGVHMMVDSVESRFTFEQCTVTKGLVLHVATPEK